MPSVQKKKKWGKKSEKRRGVRGGVGVVGGREKAKSKRQNCCLTFKPKNYLEILLSAHARALQVNILHLD